MPHIFCFDKLIDNILYLINQLQCMDNRVFILGRKGTGKKQIIDIVGKLINIPITYDYS